jgi:FkbM family methyltransferase
LNGRDGCRRGVSSNGEPPLVLDVGANLGWFTAYSSAAGCRVIGVEPQPRMLTLINVTLGLNDLNSKLDKYSVEEGMNFFKDAFNIVQQTKNTQQ